jgi:CDP-glucose 4,6-dehydratase
VREVVDAVLEAWGRGSWDSPAPSGAQPHEATLLSLDITKARERLGWRPLYTVDRTLRSTAAWYAARHSGEDVAVLTKADIDEYVAEGRRARAAWVAPS